ncbi:aminotransferase class IV [Pseudorhodobacter sp. MZDSW-24AT]|uniref:aminotransferase class IV n=1 Tax=Pseudorhodobacter sp. MZDSW-24AT TaxID=2052957 RepID=UPI0026C96995
MESTLCGAAGTPGLKLIETMLWDGSAVPRWPLHLARLRAGAAALGWGLPELHPQGPEGQAARLRLTLDPAGEALMEAGPVPPPIGCWRLGLAAARLRSDDPWLRVKSTQRAVYDRARASLPAGLDEVLFLNERGEVCDGSITTLFFDRGAGLRTPPLSSGLLPGVLRAEIGCPEEVLLAEDLPRVRLWLGNALRGMSEAVWLG